MRTKAVGHAAKVIPAVLDDDGEIVTAAFVQAAFQERVEMTASEEAKFLAGQERGRLKQVQRDQKERGQEILRESRNAKMRALGFTDEEINA